MLLETMSISGVGVVHRQEGTKKNLPLKSGRNFYILIIG